MAQQEFQVDRTAALYERPVMNIVDAPTYSAVKAAIEAKFSPASVAGFLQSLKSAGLRIREFEAVLTAGKLGAAIAAEYAKLTNADQGQIREFYLASLEKVAPALRAKFSKLYAYY